MGAPIMISIGIKNQAFQTELLQTEELPLCLLEAPRHKPLYLHSHSQLHFTRVRACHHHSHERSEDSHVDFTVVLSRYISPEGKPSIKLSERRDGRNETNLKLKSF